MTKRLKLSSPPSSTSSPSDMPPRPSPQFSSLPAEIRTSIYNHLFSLPNIQPTRLRTYRSNPPITLHRPVFAAPTALFLTSRQIGAEARKVFYADNLLALISIEITALSAPLVWLLKALPESITWSLLPDDAPRPRGCTVKITYHRGRVDHEDFGSDDDENDGGGGGQSKPLPPSSPSTPGEESPQQQQHNNTKNKIKQSSIIIATASLDRLCREWQYSELTLPNCVFTIHTLPSSGWDLARLTEMIWRPLTRLSHVRSVHSRGEGEGSGDGGGRAGELFHPVTIVDRTKVFEGIAFPKSERSKLREKLWRRWDQNLKKRARKGAEQRSELALLRRPGRYGRTGRWWDDEESGLEVGKMAERLVREMMKEGNEEEKKLDLGYFLEEVAREQQEGGLI